MTDLHVHTIYSDGKNTPEEIVLAAIEKGLATLGFSDHSYTFFDTRYCMKKENIAKYKKEIALLKEKYRDKIEILCGIEQDFDSDSDTDGYDYIIGSVHYLTLGNEYIDVDYTPETLREAADKYFGGDIYSLTEEYYKKVALVAEKTGATVIGHFDLITKFNQNGELFDQNHPRYIAAWKAAADRLLKADIPFEINTGAMSRGYRTTPYPAADIKAYIKEKGGRFIKSSDSHSADTLAFKFEEITI